MKFMALLVAAVAAACSQSRPNQDASAPQPNTGTASLDQRMVKQWSDDAEKRSAPPATSSTGRPIVDPPYERRDAATKH